MAIKRRKFIKGIRIKPENIEGVSGDDLTLEGEIGVDSDDNKLKARLDSETRSVVTEDQSQTLTNKTIDATAATGTNTLSADSVDILYNDTNVTENPVGETPLKSLGNDVQSALDAIKIALDDQNDASEINYSNIAGFAIDDYTGGTGVDNVKDALDILDEYAWNVNQDTQSNINALEDHTDPGAEGAHQAENIEVTPFGNLESTDVGSALNELQTDIDDLVTLSGVAANSTDLGTFTGSIISDNTTVKGALQELETQSTTNASTLGSHIANTTSAHGAMGAVVGTLNPQIIKFKQYEGAYFRKMQQEFAEDNTQSGTDVVLTEPTDPIVRLLGDVTPLESIAGISQASYAAYQVVTLVNVTANDIEIKNNTGTTAEERILTGTDDDITLAPDAALFLKYDATSSRWRVIGGTGGASTVVKGTAGENLTALQFAALDLDGNIYKLDASNDDRIESVGIVKADALSTESVKTITSGIIKGFTGLTVGAPLYADPLNAGGYTQTDPENSIFDNKWVIRLGIAISATQLLLNPDQATSAYFKSEVQADVPILNNQSSSQNLTSLAFNGAEQNRVTLEYGIFRRTDTQSLAQAGELKLVYNEEDMEWFLSDSYAGQNAGVNFSITTSGQLQYTSTNLTGANYDGRLEYRIAISTGLAETSLLVNNGDLITKESGVTARLPIGTSGQVLSVSESGLLTYSDRPNPNYIINGNFDFWQRGASASLSTSTYLADRWLNGFLNNNSANISRQTFANIAGEPPGSKYFHRFEYPSSTNNSNERVNVLQRIEGVTRLAGKTVTVSMWVKANANKFIAIEMQQIFGISPSINVSGSKKFAIGTTWQKITHTISIPSVEGKSIGDTSYTNLVIWLSGGSDINDRTESLGNQSGTFDIAQVKLEEGDTATPFVLAGGTIEGELAACQRYYEQSSFGAIGGQALGYVYTAPFNIINGDHAQFGGSFFRTVKRATPTVTLYGVDNTGTAPNTINIGGVSRPALAEGVSASGFRRITNISGVTWNSFSNVAYNWVADAEF